MQTLALGKSTWKQRLAGRAIVALIVGMAVVPNPASAQEENSSAEVPVHMVVTVKAQHSGQIPALGADEVRVYQGNKMNQVKSFIPLQGTRAGLELFILIDDSSRTSVSLQFSSIAKFIQERPATTSIGVGYMRNGTVYVAQNLTSDRELVQKSLRLPLGATVGLTSPYLSLTDLMKKWPVSENRREILMITSGTDPLGGGFSNDPYTNPYLDAAADRAQRGGFIVYSIYFPGAGFAGRGRNRTFLAQSGLDILAQRTGGEAYYLASGDPVNITPYLQDVSNRLNHQYELTFLAKGAKKPTLQPVKVKTELPNTGLVTAEKGYVGTGM